MSTAAWMDRGCVCAFTGVAERGSVRHSGEAADGLAVLQYGKFTAFTRQ